MLLKLFLASDAGKAMLSLAVASMLITWPPAASWLAACLCLSYSIFKLQHAFISLEAAERLEATIYLRSNDAPALDVAELLAAGGDRLPAAR